MAIDRRDFMKLAGVCGMGVAVPFAAKAQSSVLYDGPLFVMVNAAGGWDPTSFCDPKGQLSEDEEDPMNQSYRREDIRTAGNINYAPVGSNVNFFETYYERLLVLNGVDTATNGHDSGSRHMWSGKLADGNPSFSALVAAVKSRASPMAFLSNGGYDRTQGLVAPTRAGNTNVLERIAFPHRQDTDEPDSLYHTQPTVDRIKQAQIDRLARQRARTKLPKRMKAMDTLFTARAGESEVRRLTEFLPDELDNSGNRLIRQAQLALASYRAGITVSVNLNIGGFDTHGNHDGNHIPRLGQMFDGVDFFMQEAERQGVADRVVVVMASDFGRTPGYNNGNGKDHWSITSYMLMGAGIRGNRVIGSTDERHRALTINANTLESDSNGIRIEPGHVHAELRRLAGVEDSELSAKFPVNKQVLGLFS